MRSCNACVEMLEGRVMLAAFTPDADFGKDGDAYASYVGSHRDAPRVVTRQPDGKILIVSTAEVTYSFQILLVRLNPDGSYDRTFGGGDGKIRTRLDVPEYYHEVEANDVALQPDGKIVVAGESASRFMVLRFNADGTPDRGFGERGVVIPDLGAYPVSDGGAAGVALQRDGKIVAAGWWDSNPEEHHQDTDVIVMRLDADGTPDETFGGGDGIATTNLGATETGHDVAIDREGRIVVVGNAVRYGTPETRAHLVTRYNSDGSPDASFPATGSPGLWSGKDTAAFQPSWSAVIRSSRAAGAIAVRSC